MFFKKDTSPKIRKTWKGDFLIVQYEDAIFKIACKNLMQTKISEPNVSVFTLMGIYEGSKEDKSLMTFSEKKHAILVQNAIFGFASSHLMNAVKFSAIFLLALIIFSNLIPSNTQAQLSDANKTVGYKVSDKESMRSKLFSELTQGAAQSGALNADGSYSFNPKIDIPPLPAPELKCAPQKETQITSVPR